MRPSDPVADLLAQVNAVLRSTASDGAERFTNLTDLLEKGGTFPNGLVLLLDQFEQLQEEEPRHAPIFDFISELASRRRQCSLTCVVAFREEYASRWMDFSVRGLDARGLPRPRELILDLFRRDDSDDRSGPAVLATLATEAKLDLGNAQKHLLDVLSDRRGRISPFNLSVALLCLSQLGKSRLEARDIPSTGLQGLFANYLQGLLRHLIDDERNVVFSAIYFGLLEPTPDHGNAGLARVADGRTLGELCKGRPIDRRRLEYALNTLSQREAGLLERIPGEGEPRYRLLHEGFVPALRELSGVLPVEADEARRILRNAFLAYDASRPWQRLLRGSDLRNVLRHWQDITPECAEAGIELFVRRSQRFRMFERTVLTGIILAFLSLGSWWLQQNRDRYWRDRLADWRLPADLYDVQRQLEKLVISNESMDDARWITGPLKDLRLDCPKLVHLPVFRATLTNLAINRSIQTNRILAGLPVLHGLDLRFTALTDLSGLGNLPELTSLDISANRLTNLSGLGRFPKLASLDLSGNALSNLATLERLPKLTYLALMSNRLTDLSGLEKCEALTSLVVSYNHLTSLSGLEKLHSLTNLELSCSGMTNMSALHNVPTLTHLRMNVSMSSQTNLSELDTLPSVMSLELRGARLSALSLVEKFPNLMFLTLHESVVTNLSGLEKCTRLTSLTITDTRITGVSGLQKLLNLTNLNLVRDNLTDLNDLGTLPVLTSLGLTGNRLSSVSGLENCPKLTSLDLSDNAITNLSGLERVSTLTSLGLIYHKLSHLSSLEKLRSLKALKVTIYNSDDLSFLGKLTGLTSLDIGWTTRADEVSYLGPVPTLRQLRMKPEGLSDFRLRDVFAVAPNATFLDLSNGRAWFDWEPAPADSPEIHLGIYTRNLKPLPAKFRSLVFEFN